MSSSSTSYSPALSSSLFLLPLRQSHSSLQSSFTYIKTLIEHPSISKHTSLSQLTSYITYNDSTLYELGISNISCFDFISKLRLISCELKTIPSKHLRSLIIKGVSPFVPVIDIITLLSKTTPGLKKVHLCHRPTCPGVSLGVLLLDYHTHEAAMKALESINAKKKLSAIKGNIEAFVAEPLIDNVDHVMNMHVNVVAFENLNVGSVDVFEFKTFIETHMNETSTQREGSDEYPPRIIKVRQYANKVVVEFDRSCLKVRQLVKKGAIEYKGEVVPVKGMMKPAVNVGKYKERNVKVSVLALCEEDRETLMRRLGEDGKEDGGFRKKAEGVYMKNVAEEKKEMERERERRKEEEKLQRNKREREYSDSYYSNNSASDGRRRVHDASLQRYDVGSSMSSAGNNGMRNGHHRSHRSGNGGAYMQNQSEVNVNDVSQLLHNDNLNQLLQLLSNPSINQLLTSINPQNQKQVNSNQMIPQQNQQQQSLNSQQQNIMQLQSLIYQQQQQTQQQPHVQNFLQNPNILNLLHNTQDPQTQSQQTQSSPANIHQFNPLLQLPKMIPTPSNVPTLDLNQTYFNPIRNQPPQQQPQPTKNFYAQTNPTPQVQAPFPPFPGMNDIFINPYQGIPGHNIGDQPPQNPE